MKRLQRFCVVLSLALVLAAPVVAGDMQTGLVPPPPPPTAPPPGPSPENHCLSCGAKSVTNNEGADFTEVDPLEQVAMYILLGALSFF